ncbi:armadillo-type protein [Mycena galericulata]|nr:armadillo-type protein [Mycena galericulata]
MAVQAVSRMASKTQTPASIHSWWSDSNPGLQGATINLHTLTKPLMRLMYHRQALGFIQRNGDTPLSSKILEIYSTYLLYKYVSPSTQVDILKHLTRRAESEDDARTIVNSPILVQIPHLLGTANEKVREVTCMLVGYLALRASSFAAILAASPFERLVSLLRDADLDVIQQAAYALQNLAYWADGTLALINANTLQNLSELLESGNEEIRKTACILVRKLAWHESSLAVILDGDLLERLVSLLRDTDPDIVQHAIAGLSEVAYWANGAQAVIETSTLPHLSELLESASKEIRKNACNLVGNLARHASTLPAILGTNPFERLVDADSDIIQEAAYGLANLAYWVDGAQAVIQANTLLQLSELLESTNSVIIQHATYALVNLAKWPDGAQAVINTNTLPHLSELLESASKKVQESACMLVGNLAMHGVPGIQDLKLCMQLVLLLRQVHRIYSSKPSSFKTTVDAMGVGHILELLKSADPWVLQDTCRATSALARISEHPAGVAALVETAVMQVLEGSSEQSNEEIDEDKHTILENINRYQQGKAAAGMN